MAKKGIKLGAIHLTTASPSNGKSGPKSIQVDNYRTTAASFPYVFLLIRNGGKINKYTSWIFYLKQQSVNQTAGEHGGGKGRLQDDGCSVAFQLHFAKDTKVNISFAH